MPAVPTLVESCSRFMSLSSRPKSRAPDREEAKAEPWACDDALPASRVTFHKTFSMLINMGNVDKGCRRTISREEQVWQNELKDLIWLELQAKVADRTLAEQDTYLCAQRKIVPTVIKNICEYRFVNHEPCRQLSQVQADPGSSREDLVGGSVLLDDDDVTYGCLTFSCTECSAAVGRAMRELSILLDSFYNAVSLYPSTKALTHDHPLVATPHFKNRLKAMCLWYNTALNMRLKMVSVRRLLRSIKLKSQRKQRVSLDFNISRQSSETHRAAHVRFNLNGSGSALGVGVGVGEGSSTPTDSSNSDSSYAKEEDDKNAKEKPDEDAEKQESSDEKQEGREEGGANNLQLPVERDDEVDSGVESMRLTGQTTPEIIIDSYSTSDTSDSQESYASVFQGCAGTLGLDPYDIGPLDELTQLRLLGKCPVSLYRAHHQEILKTQGVRRCMMFIDKMRQNTLQKAYYTLDKPDNMESAPELDDVPAEVFRDPKEEELEKGLQREDVSRAEEMKRFGWWSEESRAMRLPSYRCHFLLLSSVCMEATHDYLELRLDARPDTPSCLTVKQLIHELKEGLDIASEVRRDFIRNLRAALAGRGAGPAAPDLLLTLRTFDDTVETVLKLYLSYLTTMSEKEALPRGALQAEWRFTARLARRIKCAHHLAPTTFSTIVCNQLNRLLKSFSDKFKLVETEKYKDREVQDPTLANFSPHGVYAVCRAVQNIFASEREHTLQAAQWARALAARLARAPPPAYLVERTEIFNSLMAIRDFIVQNVQFILKQSVHAFPEAGAGARDLPESVITRVRELLLQTCKLGFEIHKELHQFVNEPTPRAPPTLSPPRAVRNKFMRTDSVIEDYEATTLDDRLFDNENQTQASIEALLTGGPQEQGVEEQVELRNGGGGGGGVGGGGVSSAEKEWAARVARAVIQFAQCWMKFVVERCDTGRGLRPRWASQGLEFLMLACDPCNTKHLTEGEFEKLKQLMDECISHVIGKGPATPDAAAAPSPRPRPRLHSPMPSSAACRGAPSPPTPPCEPDPVLAFNGPDSNAHAARVAAAVRRVEHAREAVLARSKAVGRVVTAAVATYEPKLRQLTFKWQRGLKIGAGTFGKVYTVVNTESGQLLAMKELSIGANDRRAFQRAANELRVLEGVIHPHLVRYYGAELHREEMLLFMELCVEGSLEALVATTGALLEGTVRRYSRQLLSAVQALHTRSIAHRDIKSGNIFLTNEGNCLKLGDFGCAVKIRANTTAPNELQGFVGTQAYMAPEVFMNPSGHGRAADIWSLGCVVTEMASGKRPFTEYDSNYQIMFRVGMGERPHVPDSLSEEGRHFCRQCLTHEPEARPRAHDLMLHTFLMVNADENDCKCEPAFLIA